MMKTMHGVMRRFTDVATRPAIGYKVPTISRPGDLQLVHASGRPQTELHALFPGGGEAGRGSGVAPLRAARVGCDLDPCAEPVSERLSQISGLAFCTTIFRQIGRQMVDLFGVVRNRGAGGKQILA